MLLEFKLTTTMTNIVLCHQAMGVCVKATYLCYVNHFRPLCNLPGPIFPSAAFLYAGILLGLGSFIDWCSGTNTFLPCKIRIARSTHNKANMRGLFFRQPEIGAFSVGGESRPSSLFRAYQDFFGSTCNSRYYSCYLIGNRNSLYDKTTFNTINSFLSKLPISMLKFAVIVKSCHCST